MYKPTQNHPQPSCHNNKLTCWLTCSLAGWLASWLARLTCWSRSGTAQETESSDGWAHPPDEGSGVLGDLGTAGACNKQSTWAGWQAKKTYFVFSLLCDIPGRSHKMLLIAWSQPTASPPGTHSSTVICSVTHNDIEIIWTCIKCEQCSWCISWVMACCSDYHIYGWKCEESTEWRALQWQNQRNHLALLVSIVPHCLQQSARGMTLQNKASNPLLQVLPQTNVRMWTTAFPKFKLPCKRVPAKELSPMRRSPARISNSQPLSHWGPFL